MPPSSVPELHDAFRKCTDAEIAFLDLVSKADGKTLLEFRPLFMEEATRSQKARDEMRADFLKKILGVQGVEALDPSAASAATSQPPP